MKLTLLVGNGAFPTYTVSIHSDSSGAPGARLGDVLTHPNSLLHGRVNTAAFTAPVGGISLDSGTKYWVVIDTTTGHNNTSLRLTATSSDDEDSGGATGWSIADNSRQRSWNHTTWAISNSSGRIEIHGIANP